MNFWQFFCLDVKKCLFVKTICVCIKTILQNFKNVCPISNFVYAER